MSEAIVYDPHHKDITIILEITPYGTCLRVVIFLWLFGFLKFGRSKDHLHRGDDYMEYFSLGTNNGQPNIL